MRPIFNADSAILGAVESGRELKLEPLPPAAIARLIACYLLRTEARLSFPAIGRLLERHHTTVMAACSSIAGKLKRWPDGKMARAVGQALEALALEKAARE